MVKLRALTQEDAETTWKWRNLPDIKYFFSGHPFPVNYEKEYKWIQSVLVSNIPHSYFAIEYQEKIAGLVALRDIDLLNRKAEYSIFVAAGKGLGRSATNQILKFGFVELGLERIWLKVMEENILAIQLYKKSGFIEEGVLRNSVFKEGKFHNEKIMSILKEEFTKNS